VDIVVILIPFLLLGGAVLFIAFSGGPGKAREAYRTRGSRSFRIAIPLIYILLGVVVPALVLGSRREAAGAEGSLENAKLTGEDERGKSLFRSRCATCHNLDAVNARGVTGPDLDNVGQLTPERVLGAIEEGGTGQKRMPAGLLEGDDAAAVAEYVSKVAAR